MCLAVLVSVKLMSLYSLILKEVWYIMHFFNVCSIWWNMLNFGLYRVTLLWLIKSLAQQVYLICNYFAHLVTSTFGKCLDLKCNRCIIQKVPECKISFKMKISYSFFCHITLQLLPPHSFIYLFGIVNGCSGGNTSWQDFIYTSNDT